jgi:putative ubiquitin-RnfH superfamily antitoxin RatB of RatAB toxin-antitoxin module
VPERIHVEVVYAEPGRQFLRLVELGEGATAADAIEASGIEREAGIDATTMAIGIWSKPARAAMLLREGDRVEIYRPLKADPKESRRRRAARAKEPRG